MKRLILPFMIILFLSSCLTTKRVERFLNEKENLEFAAGFCAEKFPVKTDSFIVIQTDSIRLKEYIETIREIKIDDTTKPKSEIIELIKYKIQEKIIKSPPVIQTKTIIQENTAKIKKFELENDRLKNENFVLKNENFGLKRFKFLTFVIWILLLLALFLYIYMRKNKLIP